MRIVIPIFFIIYCEVNKKIIYVTDFCAKKDNYIKKTQEKVTPDKLYVATTTHDSLNDVLRI
jgi:hypothetical protein